MGGIGVVAEYISKRVVCFLESVHKFMKVTYIGDDRLYDVCFSSFLFISLSRWLSMSMMTLFDVQILR